VVTDNSIFDNFCKNQAVHPVKNISQNHTHHFSQHSDVAYGQLARLRHSSNENPNRFNNLFSLQNKTAREVSKEPQQKSSGGHSNNIRINNFQVTSEESGGPTGAVRNSSLGPSPLYSHGQSKANLTQIVNL
jgi:hypothetical protein